MATMLDKIMEGNEPQFIDAVKPAMRWKPEGPVLGEIRQADTVAALLDANNRHPE